MLISQSGRQPYSMVPQGSASGGASVPLDRGYGRLSRCDTLSPPSDHCEESLRIPTSEPRSLASQLPLRNPSCHAAPVQRDAGVLAVPRIQWDVPVHAGSVL